MTDGERLIKLYKEATTQYLDYLESIDQKGLIDTEGRAKFTVDYLIANGVIVPPCKVGDKVYYIHETYWDKDYKNQVINDNVRNRILKIV